MKPMNLIILLLLSISLQSMFGFGKSENIKNANLADDGTSSISGVMEKGLRVIPVDVGKNEIMLSVYRGDYIVLKASDGKSHRLVIPSLNVDSQIPVPENEKPYIKMKETGLIEFSLDDSKGQIKVIDFEGPRYWEVSSLEGAELIKNINPFILDVRTEGEYKEGHLEDAFLLPVQILEKEIAQIAAYKNEDILIYCRSGNRSTVASKILLDAGFTNVYNLRYGISGWGSDGYPIIID